MRAMASFLSKKGRCGTERDGRPFERHDPCPFEMIDQGISRNPRHGIARVTARIARAAIPERVVEGVAKLVAGCRADRLVCHGQNVTR